MLRRLQVEVVRGIVKLEDLKVSYIPNSGADGELPIGPPGALAGHLLQGRLP